MRTLTKLNGSIESPNKPCSYGGEQDCHWSIQPNSSSPIETIWMWFEGVNLAYDGHGDRHCGLVSRTRSTSALLFSRNFT